MKFFAAIASVLAFSLFNVAAADYSGDATYYYPDGNYGSCEKKLANSEYVVALSTKYNTGKKSCGKRIRVSYKGKSVDATVQDLCPGCKPNDVDLTPVAFKKLDILDKGRIQVTWKFI